MQVQSLGQEDPLRTKWQPTPVSLPGKFHGQRSQAGYSPLGGKVGHDLVTKPPPPPTFKGQIGLLFLKRKPRFYIHKKIFLPSTFEIQG